MRLSSVSFAHPSVDVSARALMSFPGSALREAYDRIADAKREAFVLSTCLRVEVASLGGPDDLEDVLNVLWPERSQAYDGVVRRDERAFLHLARIAAGLESPLIGEPEVLGQFRHSASMVRDAAVPPGDMARLLDAAIAVGRAARREIGDSPRGSLASVAVDATSGLEPVAVLGSGAMARAAAELLDGRTWDVFARRSTQVAGRETLPWSEAEQALASYPVLISTVPGKSRLFGHGVVAQTLNARSEPMLIIDLGMPPAFEPPEGDGIRYVGVDELASSVAPKTMDAAEDFITELGAASWARLDTTDRVGAVIASIVNRAELAAAEEAERFGRRLISAENPDAVLAQLARTVARRILHEPISYLGSAAGGDAVDAIAGAFGVDDE